MRNYPGSIKRRQKNTVKCRRVRSKHHPLAYPTFFVDLFDYKTSFDVEEFLEQSQKREEERLEEELERVNKQLESRQQLHEEAIDELTSKRDWYIDRLETLYQRGTGKQGKRTALKTRIEELYAEIRSEKRSHWRDRQELEQERREILHSLAELNDDTLSDLF